MSDLEILFPEPLTVHVGRMKVEVRPVQLRHFQLYGEQASALLAALASLSADQLAQYGNRNAKHLRKLLRAATSLNAWQLWRLPAPIAMQLASYVVQANTGFFAEALPVIAKALGGEESRRA